MVFDKYLSRFGWILLGVLVCQLWSNLTITVL